jgi:tyrosine aminotransferase
LQLGDPTVFGNFEPCPGILEAITAVPNPGASYTNALGTDEARKAIALYHSSDHDTDHDLSSSSSSSSSLQIKKLTTPTKDNVIVASGCSGTLEIVLTALLDPGTILLVPQPGKVCTGVLYINTFLHTRPNDSLVSLL